MDIQKQFNAQTLLKRFQLEQFPEPEYLHVDKPILLCHGYGALASMLNKKSPLYDVCMFLRSHGVLSFAPNVVPYAKIEIRAEHWKQIIETICERADSNKLHVIAHSMGGLDMRYACDNLGLCRYVESLTTIATPHRGASLADFTLNAPDVIRKNLTAFTDWIADYIFPDEKSDTHGALHQLRTNYIRQHFNSANGDISGLPCYSYSAAVGKGTDHSVSNLLKYQNSIIYEREGINDGFVSVESAKWGDHIKTIGLSHLEQIKINISKDRIPIWENFWLGIVENLSLIKS